MAVHRTPTLEQKIDELAASGRFESANVLIDEAVELLERKLERDALLASIDDAFRAIERGEGVEPTAGFWESLDEAADEAERAGRPLVRDVLP